MDIQETVRTGNTQALKQHLTESTNVNVQDINGSTSLDWAVVPTTENQTETADLLRKHVGKTSDELKAAAN